MCNLPLNLTFLFRLVRAVVQTQLPLLFVTHVVFVVLSITTYPVSAFAICEHCGEVTRAAAELAVTLPGAVAINITITLVAIMMRAMPDTFRKASCWLLVII